MQSYKNYDVVLQYAKDITKGTKIACKELKQACQRFLDDLENTSYDFRPEDAEYVINIIENTIVHIKGDLTGRPFLLEAWEKFICYNLVGFYLRGKEERRFHEAFIFIPRKNGKTPFAAALAWALSLLEMEHTSTLYIIANKLDRALESFHIILENIERLGAEDDFRILNNNQEHSISRSFWNEEGEKIGGIKIQALASDAKRADGLNANLIILDEIHAYKNANEYHVYKQAMKAYTNKLLIGITTAGINMNSFCFHQLQYCMKILNQTEKDEQYFIFICKADDEDDYLNPIEHEKANPNYGITIRPSDMENEALQAQNNPISRSEFLNKSLNIYTNVESAYFNIAEVQTSDEAYQWSMEELAKIPIQWTGGADLSVRHDLTAAVLYGEYEGVAISISHGFIPITQARKKADEDNIPFFDWVDHHWLTTCNSDVVELDDVVLWFKEMRDKGFKIRNVGFDRYRAREFVTKMKNARFKMKDVDQAYWKKSEAFREIERKIKEKKFYYVHNKAFEYCISNVKAIEDSEERIRYEKIAQNQRMDLFDATVIACKQFIIDHNNEKVAGKWGWSTS